jgi:hypothetical protein
MKRCLQNLLNTHSYIPNPKHHLVAVSSVNNPVAMRWRYQFDLMRTLTLLILVLIGGCRTKPESASIVPAKKSSETMPTPQIQYAPQQYVCYRTNRSVIVDGRMDEQAWKQVPWTELFVDIEGNLRPKPYFETRAKLMWDSLYLYVAAELKETDVWGKLTERDAVIYHDNDFEVFIDPNMDAHEYYELELNALNTVWDLLLLKPYRDGGPAVNAWDIQGLQTAVTVQGTLNHPGDTDTSWTVEVAFPWAVLKECAHRATPPQDGDQWKINFSRVEWRTEVIDNKYSKVIDASSGKSLAEYNWVWSPQGLIAMHYPEMWGLVQFTDAIVGSQAVAFILDPVDSARWALWRVYYAQRDHFIKYGTYTSDFTKLGLVSESLHGFVWPPKLDAASRQFCAQLVSQDGRLRLLIDQEGRLRQETNGK